MYIKTFLSFVLFIIPLAAGGQEIVLPETIDAVVKEWIMVIPIKVDGSNAKWRVVGPTGTVNDPNFEEVRLDDLFGPELGSKAKGKVYKAKKPGIYRVEAWVAKGDVPSDIGYTVVTVTGPEGPEPNPQPGPTPPALTPNKVVIYHETSNAPAWLNRKLIPLREHQLFKGRGNLELVDGDHEDSAPWRQYTDGLTKPIIILINKESNVIVHKQSFDNNTDLVKLCQERGVK